MAYEKELKVAKEIAVKAGKIMLDYFDAEQGLEHKDDLSEVTMADTKINKLVIEELSKKFNDGIIGEEESTADFGNGRKWFCDPIDGTRSFVIGIPVAMFSLGLVVDGSPVLGIAYDPFQQKMFWAIKNEGSFCNDNRLQVSKHKLANNYIMLSSNPEKLINKSGMINKLINAAAKLDSAKAAVFNSCLVAQGRVAGYLGANLHPHDIAAIHVIIEEAGGRVTSYDGKVLDYTKPFRGAIISNGVVHDNLVNYAE